MAVPTSPAEWVEALCPGKESDSRLDAFLEAASYFVAESMFGDKYDYALALVVCHMFALEAMGGGNETTPGSGVAGGIKSEKEGALSQSYGSISSNISENKQYWGQTSHGMNLMALWDACILMPRTRWIK